MIEAVPERLEGSPRQLRPFWSDEFKAFAVEEASRPGANISAVARQIGILPSQLFRWRRELSGDGEQSSALAKEQQPRSAGITPPERPRLVAYDIRWFDGSALPRR
ncbi:transposase [Sinorhizobium meliloti]|uniref:transposase n=1 Tax=Rhizobium meliloti TaxID=382 RepID=UPI003988A031